jgi:hypothetical protein
MGSSSRKDDILNKGIIMKKKNEMIITTIIILILIGCFILYKYISRDITSRESFPGEVKLEETIRDYFQALNENDKKGVAEFLGVSEHDPIVEDNMKDLGGRKIYVKKVLINQEFPNIFNVTVITTDKNNEITEVYLVVEWTGKKFVISPT